MRLRAVLRPLDKAWRDAQRIPERERQIGSRLARHAQQDIARDDENRREDGQGAQRAVEQRRAGKVEPVVLEEQALVELADRIEHHQQRQGQQVSCLGAGEPQHQHRCGTADPHQCARKRLDARIIGKAIFLAIVGHLIRIDTEQPDDVQDLRRREGNAKVPRLFHRADPADQRQHDEAVCAVHGAAEGVPKNSLLLHHSISPASGECAEWIVRNLPSRKR